MLDVLEIGEVVAGHWVAISLLELSFYSFSCNEPLFFPNVFHLCPSSFRIYIVTVDRVDSAPTSTHSGFVAVTAGESIQEQHHTNIHPGFDVLDTHPVDATWISDIRLPIIDFKLSGRLCTLTYFWSPASVLG